MRWPWRRRPPPTVVPLGAYRPDLCATLLPPVRPRAGWVDLERRMKGTLREVRRRRRAEARAARTARRSSRADARARAPTLRRYEVRGFPLDHGPVLRDVRPPVPAVLADAERRRCERQAKFDEWSAAEEARIDGDLADAYRLRYPGITDVEITRRLEQALRTVAALPVEPEGTGEP